MVNLTFDSVTMRSVSLSWLPPPRNHWNGLLSLYTVTYEPLDAGFANSGIMTLESANFVNNPSPRNDMG